MATLCKLSRLSGLLLSRSSRLYSSASSKDIPVDKIDTLPPWTEIWKPGPYPRTEEERRKAAEKYGMHPDEYVPQDSEYDGCGDYPKLPHLGYDARDPYYPYDMPAIRRNWNEVVHEDEDMMGGDRYGSYGVRDAKYDYSLGFLGLGIMVTMGAFLAQMYNLDGDYHPVTEKQYLGTGKKHYTFEFVG